MALEALNTSSIEELKKAQEIFRSLGDYQEANSKIIECDNKIKEITQRNDANEAEALRKKKRNRIILISSFSIISIFIIIVAVVNFIPYSKYKKAKTYLNNGQYDEATELFTELENYKDSSNMISEVQLQRGINLIETQDYPEANKVLSEISEYKNVKDYLSVSQCAKWYDNNFNPTFDYELRQLSPNVEGLLAAKTEIGEKYANMVLKYIYEQCEEMNALREFYDRIDFLEKMNYKSDECEKLKKEYEDMFSWYDDNLYVTDGVGLPECIILEPNLQEGTVKVTLSTYLSGNKKTIDEEYTCELKPDHNLTSDKDILGNTEQFRIQKDSIEHTDGFSGKKTKFAIFVQ